MEIEIEIKSLPDNVTCESEEETLYVYFTSYDNYCDFLINFNYIPLKCWKDGDTLIISSTKLDQSTYNGPKELNNTNNMAIWCDCPTNGTCFEFDSVFISMKQYRFDY